MQDWLLRGRDTQALPLARPIRDEGDHRGEGDEDYEGRLQKWREAMDRMKVDPGRLTNPGVSGGRSAAALAAISRALECAPDHGKLWYRYGFLLHRHARQPATARLALQRAVGLAPRSGIA